MAPATTMLSLILGMASCAAAFGQRSVTLSWDRSVDSNVIGYFLYVGVESGVYANPTHVGDTNTWTVNGLSEGVTNYFVVTARDHDNLESDPSNEIAYLVPGALRIRPTNPGNSATVIAVSVVAGQSYQVETSHDLVSWHPLWSTVAIANEWVEFEEARPPGISARFYRLASP